MTKNVFVFYFLLVLINSSLAQTDSLKIKTAKKIIGINVNGLGYRGDLGQGFDKWGNGIGISIKFNKKKKFNSEFETYFGSIYGQDPTLEPIQDPTIKTVSEITPVKYFKTTIFSFNYQLNYNFIKTKHWILSISQGLGLMKYTVRNESDEDLFDKISTRTKGESYNSISLILPTTLSTTYLFNNNYGINFNLGYINPNTDYLDNISKIGKRKGNDQILKIGFKFLIPL